MKDNTNNNTTNNSGNETKELISSNFEDALRKLLEDNKDEWKEFENIPEYIDRVIKNSNLDDDSSDSEEVKKDKEAMSRFQEKVIDNFTSEENKSKYKDKKVLAALEKVENELQGFLSKIGKGITKDVKILRKALKKQFNRLTGKEVENQGEDTTLDKILTKLIDPKKIADLIIQIITKGTISKAKVKSIKDSKANIEFNLGFTLDGKLERFKIGVDIKK